MGIGTFGAFTQARLAIYAAQTGLSVTGNNISNINTPGYTRQRLNQTSLSVAGSDRYYAQGDVRTGQGVLVRSISQIRSPYLDIRFREQNAKVGYMNAKLEGLDSISRILDEVGKGVDDEEGFGYLGLEISKLISALQDLAKETGHQEYDNIVRQVASNLVSRLNSYASQLEEVRQNTITDFNQDVDEVNGLLYSIRSLNEEIRKSEIHGDPALELRDERNLLIDQLSGLIDIDVTYSEEEIAAGVKVEKLTIRLGNANPDSRVRSDESLLVDGVYAAQLSLGKPMENEYFGEAVDWDDPSEKLQELIKKLDPDDTMDDDELKQLVEDYVSSPYLYQKKDADGNIIEERPVSDIRDATILRDEDNPNFDVMVTELRNKVNELYYATEKGAVTKVDGSDKITITKDDGTTEEILIADLFDKSNSYSLEEKNKPSKGDTTITIYKRTPIKDANGDVTGYNYTKQEFCKVASKPVALDDNDLGGELQAERELLTEKGEFTDLNVLANVDENAAGKRGVQYYQNALDLLAKQLAEMFNEANQGFRMDPKGNYITRGTNDAGEEIGVPVTLQSGTVLNKNVSFSDLDAADQAEILTAIGLGGYTQQMLSDEGIDDKAILNAYLKGQTYDTTDPDDHKFVDDPNTDPRGIFDGGVLFSNGNNSDDTTNITASNISISASWQKSHILVRSFTCPDKSTEPASGQSDNITHMKYLLDTQKWDFYPNTLEGTGGASGEPMFRGTIFEMWNNVGSTLGKDQDYTNTELTVAYESALAIDTDRDSLSSVDFNDEAMNLMMYAKSYNAACRLMTTIDSVLDKLINNTGMTT